jgi:hypothetical protein
VSKKILDKKLFTDKIFVEYSLTRVTLGKGFDEYKIVFAEYKI